MINHLVIYYMRFFLVNIVVFLFCSLTNAQSSDSFQENEETLIQLSKTFLKDSLVQKRLEAEQAFSSLLQTTLTVEQSFKYPFASLENISILYPKDSTFRVFTWQLYVDKEDYRYGGFIQTNTNKVFPLNDVSGEIAPYDLEYDILDPTSWYGAVYFNIHQFDTKDGRKYLLFGFDGFSFFQKRKILEVLHFDEQEQPVFGSPSFAKVEAGYDASTKNRLYLEYSAEVAAKLNFDAHLGMIIKDHLIAMRSPYRGGGMVNIPDGSYEGYALKDGVWTYIEKVFHQVSERPPAPQPILNGKNDKDLFGKSKKKKGKN